jgi:5-methylthioadenosine/S-adenosylhomocysteine deaminase
MSVIVYAGACVLTQDKAGRVLMNGSVAVQGDRILMVDAADSVTRAYPDAEVVDCKGRILMPGLINAHTHVALNSCRGLSYTQAHSLYEIMWPLEKYLTADDVSDLAAVGIVESLKAGTTTVADHYFFMETIARQVVRCGIRGVLGHTVMAQDGPFVGRHEMDEGIAFARRWKGQHGRVHPVLAPHAPDTMSTAWLTEAAAVAQAEDFKLHLHLAQTEREVRLIDERSGLSPVQYLASINFLSSRVVAAHCIFVSDEDLRTLAESGATAVYCPTTHSLHGRGLRAVELLEMGGRVALGTDCAAGNDDMDMFGEMQAAALSQSLLLQRDRAMRPELLLRTATLGNAEALGIDGIVGSLEQGKQADLLILRADVPRMTPLLNPVANTVMCGSESLVDRVVVAGETVVSGGRVLTVDEADVVQRGNAAVARVMARAKAQQPALFGELMRMAPGLQ